MWFRLRRGFARRSQLGTWKTLVTKRAGSRSPVGGVAFSINLPTHLPPRQPPLSAVYLAGCYVRICHCKNLLIDALNSPTPVRMQSGFSAPPRRWKCGRSDVMRGLMCVLRIDRRDVFDKRMADLHLSSAKSFLSISRPSLMGKRWISRALGDFARPNWISK